MLCWISQVGRKPSTTREESGHKEEKRREEDGR
jgi:hypothetical protein